MSEKHTPGPWYVRPRNGPGSITAEVCYGSDDECITDGVYEMADARLIAAAPELLDALLQWSNGERDCDPMEIANARIARDAAIAKATGKEGA